MRKFLTTLLAASAFAVPATAATMADGPVTDRSHERDRADEPSNGDRGARAERASRNEGGAQRAEQARPERPQIEAPRAESSSRSADWSRPSMGDGGRRERPDGSSWQRADGGRRDRPEGSSSWQGRDRNGTLEAKRGSVGDRRRGDWTRQRGDTAVYGGLGTNGMNRPTGSFGTQSASRDRHTQWTRDWRNDRRYDWRSYRTQNRSAFRVGIYYDPYGTNYRRWNIGWSMRPNYYQANYWINDPWQYRLPEVYGPYRWVRYYDDAVLVNTFSGEVVDVIYNFFW